MRTNDFVKRLTRKVRREKARFYLDDMNRIRLENETAFPVPHCPLSFVAGTEPCSTIASAHRLHMSRDLADRIAEAADNEGYPGIRKRLLKAVGL